MMTNKVKQTTSNHAQHATTALIERGSRKAVYGAPVAVKAHIDEEWARMGAMGGVSSRKLASEPRNGE